MPWWVAHHAGNGHCLGNRRCESMVKGTARNQRVVFHHSRLPLQIRALLSYNLSAIQALGAQLLGAYIYAQVRIMCHVHQEMRMVRKVKAKFSVNVRLM